MDIITDSKKVVLKNVDAQNVTIKCKCPRCRSEYNINLIDFRIFTMDCGFCADEGWDDCLMPVTEIEVTHK